MSGVRRDYRAWRTLRSKSLTRSRILRGSAYNSITNQESDRFPIAAQPHRCCQKGRGECQADPQTRAGAGSEPGRYVSLGRLGTYRVMSRRQWARRPDQSVPHQGSEMPSVESNLLDPGDRYQRQGRP